jgi:glucosamine--fructose-6-phosphate aminotransferase (isomerizing)
MCGIAGIISNFRSQKIIPNLLSILSNLVSRGKDGTGIGYIDQNGKIVIQKKDIAANDFLEEYVGTKIDCNIAIGHVRAPTVGIVSEFNSHPLFDCYEKIAVIHNGTIKNRKKLRVELENEGHIFRGTVDSELIPHLIEKYYNEYNDLEKSISKTVTRLEGFYTFCVISNFEPENVYLYCHHFPLLLLKDKNKYYFSSERSPLEKLLKKPIRVKNLKKDEITVLSADLIEN